MASNLLVDYQIDAGKALIEQLLLDGVDASVAGWIKLFEGSWYFLVASPTASPADFQRLYQSLGRLPEPRLTPLDIMFISAEDPIAQDAIKFRDRYKPFQDKSYPEKRLGKLDIEQALIYGKPTGAVASGSSSA